MKRRNRSEKGIVISCFDFTGIFVEPWLEAGFECHIVDIQHPKKKEIVGNLTKWGMDIREWEKEFFLEHGSVSDVVIASFFPPCTDLSVSGARWFKSKEIDNPGCRKRAMDLVYLSNTIGKRLECPFFIENPVSVISSEWRKPDFSFHPFEYGGYRGGEDEGYNKKTCLWTGGGFQLPPKKPISLDPKTADRIWKMGPSPQRQNLRSKTPRGFSQAVFEFFN